MIPFHNICDELSVIEKVLMRGERIVPLSSITVLKSWLNLLIKAIKALLGRINYIGGDQWILNVEESIKACSVCQQSDKSARTSIAPLSPTDFPKVPWHTLAMDIVGPLEILPQDC